MTDTEQPVEDLLDLAYPYALDAVDEPGRRYIEQRVANADAATAAAFATSVRAIHETLAVITILDESTPPPELAVRVLRAVAKQTAEIARRRAELFGRRRSQRLRRSAAVGGLIVGVGVAVIIGRRWRRAA
ncbi:RskA family anti-sigma factor [Nocardia sp. NBC_01009]|uniref:RskA family anti-sigma factor n=1 Tax=Nocardia sp. NBC_01009 TaxID=2975996 RepID=UPI00386373F2|nr:hypothetical protein OHA42_19480 [Nocardia sp. NBC_01009]